MPNATRALIEAYFPAFHDKDPSAILARVTDAVEHHVNQGETRRGKPAFAVAGERIARIATYSNLRAWIAQVAGPVLG